MSGERRSGSFGGTEGSPRVPRAGSGEQSVTLRSREEATISGVLHVTSFDETTVLLDTTLGALRIRGEGLQIKQLDLAQGAFRIEGRIDSLAYDDERGDRRRGGGKGGHGVFGSLFR